MRKITVSDRILFLVTCCIAAYKIVAGMDQYSSFVMGFYTVAFGVFVLAGLMLLLFGFELLTNRFFPVVATLIPISLSLGLVQEYLPQMAFSYSLFIGGIYILSVWVRFTADEKMAALVLALVHGVSGLLVFILPVVLYVHYGLTVTILLVSFGGLILSIEGIFLTLQKTGYLKMKLNTIFAWFPLILLTATAAFVGGLSIE